MKQLTVKQNELTAEEFILLWETVWGKGPTLEQTRLAMEHTLFRVSVFDRNILLPWPGSSGTWDWITISRM